MYGLANFKCKITCLVLSCRATALTWPKLPHCWDFEITQLYTLTYVHSLERLLTRDQSVAVTCTWPHSTLTRDRHPYPKRDWNPAIPVGDRPQTRLRPRDYRDRHSLWFLSPYFKRGLTNWLTVSWLTTTKRPHHSFMPCKVALQRIA
jgi:hypothetical protein